MTTQIISRVGGCRCTVVPRAGASAVYSTVSRVSVIDSWHLLTISVISFVVKYMR